MLTAAQRLRRREEFTAVVRAGRRAGRGTVVVHLVTPASRAERHTDLMTTEPSRDEAATRAGFVVPRTVGNAVTRNRVRRRLRHLVRDRIDALPEGSWLVVRALPGSARKGYGQLGADLDAALAAARRSGSRR